MPKKKQAEDSAPTDEDRINFLEACLAKGKYTGRCVFEWSPLGRGWTLGETNRVPGYTSVRDAIDDVLLEGC